MRRVLLPCLVAAVTSCGDDSAGPSLPSQITFISIDGGSAHTCGIADEGTGYCWGINSEGQLGGPSSEVCSGMATPCRTTPAIVQGTLSLVSVSAGSHTCSLTMDGDAYCWGAGFSGQLGTGEFGGSSTTPVAVAGGIEFASISAGVEHSCGVSTSGVGYCWGANSWGQLGDGTMDDRAGPTPVAGNLTFSRVVAGARQSCGITTSGQAYCWGEHTGNASTPQSTTPVAVSSSETFASIDTQWLHVCAVTTTGDAYCWGRAGLGVLGNDTASGSIPAFVSGGLTFGSVATGAQHTCGLTTGGEAHCWGQQDFGQLGNGVSGAVPDIAMPVPVSGGLLFTSLTSGGLSSCGITTGGIAYCWGANGWGELGDGTTILRDRPVRVAGQP